MPINRLLKDRGLRPEEINLLNSAFQCALNSLGLVDRNDPITEIVARRMVDIWTSGVRDPATIAKTVVDQLKC